MLSGRAGRVRRTCRQRRAVSGAARRCPAGGKPKSWKWWLCHFRLHRAIRPRARRPHVFRSPRCRYLPPGSVQRNLSVLRRAGALSLPVRSREQRWPAAPTYCYDRPGSSRRHVMERPPPTLARSLEPRTHCQQRSLLLPAAPQDRCWPIHHFQRRSDLDRFRLGRGIDGSVSGNVWPLCGHNIAAFDWRAHIVTQQSHLCRFQLARGVSGLFSAVTGLLPCCNIVDFDQRDHHPQGYGIAAFGRRDAVKQYCNPCRF